MDAFIYRQNIDRYRKLLEIETDETQRLEIMRLLVEEEEKLKQLFLENGVLRGQKK